MDIAVYLPDELGARAKAAGLKFSALLRKAVTDELDRRQAIQRAREGVRVHRLAVYDDHADGFYDVDLVAAEIGYAENAKATAYLLDDGRVALYEDDNEGKLRIFENSADVGEDVLAGFGFAPREVVHVIHALGRRPTIEIGRRA